MMNIKSVVESVSRAVGVIRTALVPIPGMLLSCTCSRRPGFSSIITSAAIYADMYRDGVRSDNEYDDIVKKFVMNVVDKIKRGLQDDGVCFVAIPPGELKFKLIGGNAGGPILLNGENKNYVFTYAIIR